MNLKRNVRFPILSSLAALTLLVTACGAPATEQPTATLTVPALITATLPPTLTPPPSPTPIPPTPTLPVTPVEGQTTSELNVRREPTTASDSLGLVPIFANVQIVGKNPAGDWWLIIYPEGTTSTGWVTAQFVQVDNPPDVPVVGEDPNAPPSNTANATVIETVTVRSGPGTEYDAIGTAAANDTVTLTAKNEDETWFQISYPSSNDGSGWISAAFLQAQGAESLPIITEAGQVVGTGTPPPLPLPPTATIVAAPPDGDSAQSPAVSIAFSPGEARSFSYTSDVSVPEGDAEDWVQFTPYAPSGQATMMSVMLDCTGNSALAVELWQGASRLQTWDNVSCGSRSQLILSLFGGTPYELRFSPVASGSGLQYVRFTVTVQSTK